MTAVRVIGHGEGACTNPRRAVHPRLSFAKTARPADGRPHLLQRQISASDSQYGICSRNSMGAIRLPRRIDDLLVPRFLSQSSPMSRATKIPTHWAHAVTARSAMA